MLDVWKEVACGGFATAAVSGLLNPCDLVKTRRQLYGLRAPGPVALAREILAAQGVLGLWTPGLKATLAREVLYSGVTKGLYPLARDAVSGGREATLLERVGASALTGFGGSICANAVDVVKIRQFKDGSNDLLGALRNAAHTEGAWRGLFTRGLSASAPRGAAIAVGEVATYDFTKTELRAYSYFASVDGAEPFSLHLATSVITGLVATTVAAPFDTIKSRVMASSSKGFSEALSALLRAEGPAALFSGWWPAYCRLAPHAILTFPLLEQLRVLAGLKNF
ncbi:mitochondrial carrier domain-containing protein [Pelagophyceae sp. CCMP2097]|nr:mitochondrial carrier domain-containing protein [Pelagophyceae sp. CCMP2097]